MVDDVDRGADLASTPNRWRAKASGSRTQPCEAGRPGISPACSAIPSQVSRCMNGIGALL